jgi:hypothetical protein
MTSLDKFKLQAVTWESDRDSDPATFQKWAEDFSSIVRATQHGSPLEDLIDAKVGRRILQAVAVPSYLKDDPDFAHWAQSNPASAKSPLAARAAAADVDDADEVRSSPSPPSAVSGRSPFALGKSSIAYHELSEETITLDVMLYNILRLNVKGSKCELLSSVMFPSYVQGMIVL